MSLIKRAAAPSYGAFDTRNGSPAKPDPDDRPPTPAAPALPLSSVIYEPTGYEEALERLANFNASSLPDLNEQVQADPAQLGVLHQAVLSAIDWAALSAQLERQPPARDTARQLIKQLGFVAGSVNRHALVSDVARPDELEAFFEAAGFPIGRAFRDLGARGQHPAYASASTYWLLNPERLLFTRNKGEAYFHHMVNETAVRFGRAAELVGALQTGDVPFDSPRATELLAAAVEDVRPLHHGYNFLRDRDTGEERMSRSFFMSRMRSYLAPAKLCGQLVEGPNATYTPAWPRLDYALDCRLAFYTEVVGHRYKWMVREHQILLDQSLAMPSVVSQFVDQFGLADIDFEVVEPVTLLDRLKALPATALSSIHSYAELAQLVMHISSTHKTMIDQYLTKLVEKMPPEELNRIVPDPRGGVGGNPIGETMKILAMRQDHPVNRALVDLLRRRLI